jgi:hypothetical protein
VAILLTFILVVASVALQSMVHFTLALFSLYCSPGYPQQSTGSCKASKFRSMLIFLFAYLLKPNPGKQGGTSRGVYRGWGEQEAPLRGRFGMKQHIHQPIATLYTIRPDCKSAVGHKWPAHCQLVCTQPHATMRASANS